MEETENNAMEAGEAAQQAVDEAIAEAEASME
jgi:hypothetical protein